jgi:hypothetical protein
MMVARYFERRIDEFKLWWRAPVTRKDRRRGLVTGAIGGFWIGLFAGLFLIVPPAAITAFVPWLLGGAASGALLGLICPKQVLVLLFPLSTTGGGFSG